MQTDPSINTDFQGLAKLRAQAQQDAKGTLETVARQFESLFMQMMLKNMRSAELGEDLMGSDQTRMYQEMYDSQLATHLSTNGRGLGLAELMVRQLQGAPLANLEAEAPASYPVPDRQSLAFHRRELAAEPSPVSPMGEPLFDSPESFVQGLWPHAREAAAELGVAPQALLAQAALETGWGKAVIRHPDGRNSHNLFNIKADHRWNGEQVSKQTLEYRGGVGRHEQADFRSYDSYRESFRDYVEFLRGNERYQQALEQADDPVAFVEALQDAGYATDPAYAEKIRSILGRDVMASLKASGERTLT